MGSLNFEAKANLLGPHDCGRPQPFVCTENGMFEGVYEHGGVGLGWTMEPLSPDISNATLPEGNIFQPTSTFLSHCTPFKNRHRRIDRSRSITVSKCVPIVMFRETPLACHSQLGMLLPIASHSRATAQ